MPPEDLKKIQWEVQCFNAYPFFIDSVATLFAFELVWGLTYTHFIEISRNKNIEVYYDKADLQRLGDIFWNTVHKVSDLKELQKAYVEKHTQAVLDASYDEKKLAGYSISELKKLLRKQNERIFWSVGKAHIIEAASYVAEQKLSQYKIDPRSIHASEPSFIKKAEEYARMLFNSDISQKEIVDRFKEKYAWIQSSYLGRNEVSLNFIKELATHTPSSEFTPIDTKDTVVKEFINVLSHIFSWQDDRKARILESIYAAEPVLYATADRLGISREAIRFLLPEEVEKVDDPDFQKILTFRTDTFINYVPKNLHRMLLTGDKAKEFINKFNDSGDHRTELSGKVAFAGKVSGRVRICLSLESIQNFKAGEILVASMTRPEYVPAMKKALAFVTNEGGITCHAAIIARELKKPCIIGTKIATEVLKDGDMVEVDAEKGVVKLLQI